MAYASRGRTWFVVLRGARGRAIDRFLVRYTGYSLITLQYAKAAGNPYTPTLLLTTIGRRTGELRECALPYVRVGDDLVVVGSRAGGPVDPQWVHNLRAHPQVWITVDRRRRPALAHVAEGEERAALFDVVSAAKPSLAHYQARADTHGRLIPLVVLRAWPGRREPGP
jgi:deazaflavin-dependent oxidoreductase (nitroreductase family)